MGSTLHTDTVVVGAGLGGLSAAGHLQAEGYDVVVLEHHTKPGGYAHNFREQGFRFEVALHALDGMEPGGWAYGMFERLGVFESVQMNRLDPFYTVGCADRELAVPTDIDRYEDVFNAAFPGECSAIGTLFNALRLIGRDVAKYTRDRRSGETVALTDIPARYPHMAGAFASSWEMFLNQYIHDPEARAVVSTLWGYLGLPPSQVSAGQFGLTLLSYHTSGAWYPTGGSGAVTKAMAAKIEENGGRVLYRNTVTSIDVTESGRAIVTTDQGLVVEADAVVSNASPRATVALLSSPIDDPEWLAEMRSEVPSLSSFVVYLGLDRDVAAEGWDHHEFFDLVGYDIEAEYRAIREGRLEDAGMIISNYTVVDPSCAPEGGSVVVLTALAPWGHADVWGTGGQLDGYQDNGRYIAIKEAIADALIDRAEKRIPGLRDAIVVRKVATPLTNARYVLQHEGSIYGREQTVANQMQTRMASTPIENLFLTGAWTAGGGMTLAVGSGRTAAATAHRYLAATSSQSAPSPEPQ